MSSVLSYSTFTAVEPNRLTKAFGLDADGKLTKTTTATLCRGTVRRTNAATLRELADQLEGLMPDQATAWGVCASSEAAVVPADDEDGTEGVVSRTRKYFSYPTGPGIMMLDHDGLPDGELSGEELRTLLIEVCPALASVPMLWRPSVSAGIVAPDGRTMTGLTRHRLYIPVADARLIPAAGSALVSMLWAAKRGWIVVGSAGQALQRTLIDASVWQPERLDFCAPPILNDGLRRDRVEPMIFNGEAPYLDAEALRVNATAERKAKVQRRAAINSAKAECSAQRALWIDNAAPGLVRRRGIGEAKAREVLARAAEHLALTGDFMLIAADGSDVPVAELLEHPDRWHGERFADPLDPDSDHRVAVAILRNGNRPMLYSHRHGGVRYEMLREAARVQVGKGRRAQATDVALRALRERGDLYDFGDHAVAYVVDGRAHPVTLDWLIDHLDRVCSFYRVKASRGDADGPPTEIPEDAPQTMGKTILAKHGSRGFKKLVAVITAPTLRLDGSIVCQPGHDEASGLLYDSEDADAPSVPANPTPTDALSALRTLWAPFAKFPIVDAVSFGVLLHGLLTAVIRASLPTAPGIGIDTPTAGTGKTLLARCIGILSTGHDPAILPPAEGDEETRKRLTSLLRDGARVALWDNLRDPLGCAALDSFLTAPTFSDRVLGVSETVALPNRAMFIATGNNLRLAGDTWRRVLVMRLDAECERPYTRDFEFDPAQLVMQRRMQYVVAALTIIRAYIHAGRPKAAQGRTASFEVWDDLVRQPICWLAGLVRESGDMTLPELDDPLKAAEKAFEHDAETAKLSALLATWHASFRSKPTTIAEAKDASCMNHELRGAMEEIAGQGNNMTVNARVLGRWIERHVGQRLAGLRFVRGKMRNGIVTWLVASDFAAPSPDPLNPTNPTVGPGQPPAPVGEVHSSGSPASLEQGACRATPRGFDDFDESEHEDDYKAMLR